ncbi:S-layer protein [Halalkaliarchaeum sp. AArc-CO]|uniref:COG1361 S-layer family protein n=1 Tax=unclassified Halalkaliarchaeum TaxID=2678344 RepID=UPI00217DD362|nr:MULTISPECIES: hypothetical protein [unclassified Halalkaliarchaeum]MDR5674459.1 hypothetical protein [Halalkaliarchaeum sp. AArc-GB]UWG51912.1 S-layer protein [Halalkaliarchaeum sp. AArc-CO]
MSSPWRRGIVGAVATIVFLSAVIAVVGISLGTGVGVVEANETRSGVVQGSAELDVTLPDNRVAAGETDTLEFFIANDGEVQSTGQHPSEAIDRATEARSVRIDVDDTRGAPIDVRTNEQFVGTIEDGESSGPHGFEVFVEEDADPGEYTIDVEVTYRDAQFVYYTQYDDGDADYEEDVRQRSETFRMTIEVEDEARFEVTNVTHDVGIGGTGLVEFEVENTGSEDVDEVVATGTAQDQDFFFGSGGPSSETFVGEWEAGETRTIAFRGGTTADAIRTFYTVDLDLEYDTQDGERLARSVRTAVRPHPAHQFRIEELDHSIGVDESGTLTLEIRNAGNEPVEEASVAATAQDQDVFFGSGGPSSETFVGAWEPGETRTVEFRAGTTEEAIEKFYAIDVDVAYRTVDDEAFERTLRTGVQPLAKQRYQVVDVDHDVAVGDDGVLEIELRNDGPRDVTEASVTVSAGDQAIVFGSGTAGETITAGDLTFQPEGPGSPTSEAFVGEWEAGESITLSYRSGATDDALEREYTVDVTVESRDADDNDLTPRSRTIGLRPLPEQSFAVGDVESSLYVGEDGTLEGTVTNTGERTVENVVVLYDSDLANLFPRETQYAVGSLEPGESAEFQYRIGVSRDAEAGPRQLELTTRYRNHRGEVRLSDATDVFATVQPQRDEFTLRPAEATLEPGETTRIEIDIENTYDETLRNVRAKLFTNSPLSSDDDEAFLTEIAPGETETIVFEVSASGGAVAKTYPVSIDFRYDDERDQTRLSDTYRVPVEVVEPAEPLVPLWLILLVLVLAALAGWRYRDRLPDREQLREEWERRRGKRGRSGDR